MNGITFRAGAKGDGEIIFNLIKGLAEYENMTSDVTATKELFEKNLFGDNKAEVIFAVYEGKEIGYALFFHNFSTFLGKAGIYLEDLYIHPDFRGRGFGKAMFRKVAETAVERDCGRLEWSCLDWNKPSIDFYISMGAVPMSEWTAYRLDEKALKNVIKK